MMRFLELENGKLCMMGPDHPMYEDCWAMVCEWVESHIWVNYPVNKNDEFQHDIHTFSISTLISLDDTLTSYVAYMPLHLLLVVGCGYYF